MLRFFAALVGCVWILSGALIGWVRYAQVDPEYSCLSFDNITVQVDTSLYMRRFYPLDYLKPGDYFASEGDMELVVETSLPHANSIHPMPYFIPKSVPVATSRLVLRNGRIGNHYVLENYQGEIRLELSVWSHNKHYIAYAWQNSRASLFRITDQQGQIYLRLDLENGNVRPIGWTADSRYFLFFYFSGTSENRIYTVDIVDWQYEVQQADQFFPEVSDLNRFYHMNKKLAGHYLALTAENSLYILDISHQTFFKFSLPVGINSFKVSWSPDNAHLYLTYSQLRTDTGTSTNDYERRTHILTITEYGILELADYSWTGRSEPQWTAQNSQFLYWVTADSSGIFSLVQYDLEAETISVIDTNISGYLSFMGDYIFIGREQPTYAFEIWDINRQQIVYQKEIDAVYDVFSSDNSSFLYSNLSDEGRYEVYRLDMETLQNRLLFSREGQPDMVFDADRIFIGGDVVIFKDVIEENTYVFDLSPLEPIDRIYHEAYFPYMIVVADSPNRIARIYDVSPASYSATEIAAFHITRTYYPIDFSLSPDEKYIAVTFADFSTYTQEIFAVSLLTGNVSPLGIFPQGHRPIWTQCTY